MSAYNPNIPQPTDNISTSQGDLLNNFSQLNIQFSGDHTAFNTGMGNGDGRHKQVMFNSPPSIIPVPTGTESSVYPNIVSAQQELFFKNAISSTQITSGSLPIWKGGTIGGTGAVSSIIASPGKMDLPNGLQMRWGNASVNTTGTTINFVSAFSTNCLSVTLTATSTQSRGSAVSNVSSASFRAYSENNGTTMYYFAIGN